MPALRRAPALAALFAAVLGVTSSACRGGGGDRHATGTATAKRDTANAVDINPVSRDKLPEGGTLRWPLVSSPPNFNTGELDGTSADTANVVGGLLPSMFGFDSEARPTVNKDYLDAAELTAREPRQVVTYRINPRAAWDDGKPISEADLEAQWKAMSGSNPAYRVASSSGYEQIESVARGADEREVVVTFRRPYADWKALFSPLYPASTNNDPAVFNDGWRARPLTTAGPFRFESLDQTAKTISLVRNPKWWANRPKLDRIVYRVIDPVGQVDALLNGEIDVLDVAADVNRLKRVEAAPGVTVHRAAGPDFRSIMINGTGEILKDVNVRRALGMAIDRTAIANVLVGPLGVEAKPLQNHIFMVSQRGYQNNAGILSAPDVNGARKLLDDAGWKLEGNGRKKDGKPLALRFVVPTGVASSNQVAELVRAMLDRIGVRVDVLSVPTQDFFKQYIIPGNFELTVFSFIGKPFPISSNKPSYASPKPREGGELDFQQNFARIGTRQIDALFDEATSEFDEQKAIDLANQIDAAIWDEVHSLTLYQRPDIAATRSALANFGAFGFASVVYEDIGFTK
ncbi:MAG: glutathione transport system substrate-binding protein [Actinomycetota bacterium]|jgi:peptide/nickel transport system substrate-binding protein|nr:glutathione transport system substrate-binding protein [Actinomycetota bacterium]